MSEGYEQKYESGNHNSQQTDPRTESQAPYLLTHRWVLNNKNTWTQGEENHTQGTVVEGRGGTMGGAKGGESWEE